jgi:hypothetical protein
VPLKIIFLKVAPVFVVPRLANPFRPVAPNRR